MYEKVRTYMVENEMVAPGDRVIAGVSGGGDSMAMLHMLHTLSKEMGFSLEAVHVHHGIRGEEADRDCQAAQEFCRALDIPCRIYRFDVPALAKKWKMGLEETGRTVRRQAFLDAQESGGGTGKIALAHNKNDLAETMLHNLARGSGLKGLAGIRAVNKNVIRPVLCLERREIDHYLKEKKIPFVTDSSNLEDAYTRNKIRHHILPLMEEEINEGAVAHMAQASRMLFQADAFFSEYAGKLAEQCAQEDGSFFLPDDFWEKPEILRGYGVMEILGRLAGKRRDLSYVHVQQVELLLEKQAGKKVLLPCGLFACREYGGIRVASEKKQDSGQSLLGEWELPHQGRLTCPLGSFTTEIFPYFQQKISEKKYTKWFDYDKIEHNLSVRTRRSGDYLQIDEKGCRKKIRRCMIDDKIPARLRESVPLVICAGEVLWMVGGRISGKYKITPDTKRVLEVRYQGGTEDE